MDFETKPSSQLPVVVKAKDNKMSLKKLFVKNVDALIEIGKAGVAQAKKSYGKADGTVEKIGAAIGGAIDGSFSELTRKVKSSWNDLKSE